MRYITLLTIHLLLIASMSLASTPGKFRFQGVASNADGSMIENQQIALRISILSQSIEGTAQYVETHTVDTDSQGFFQFMIGDGSVTAGNLTEIQWGENRHFLKIEIDPTGGSNYSALGTQELVSVPYAEFAQHVANDAVDDADADPTNERISSASLTNTDLIIEEGGTIHTIDLSGLISSSTPQTLSLTNAQLSISNGNSVDLSVLTDGLEPNTDAQAISLNNNILSISGNESSIDLSKYLDNTDAQELTITGTELAISGGNSVDISSLQDGVQDDDADPANELQSLTFENQILTLTNDPNESTIDLSGYDSDASDDFDGDYNSLTNQPTLFSGSYNDLTDTPTLPSSLSDLSNDLGFITDPNDADADPSNELQNLTFQNNILSITGLTDAATINLAPFSGNNTDEQAISLTNNILTISGNVSTVDLSAYLDNTDAQTLSLSGTDLSISGGNTIDLSSLQDGVNDADADATNEIQNLNFVGGIISLSSDPDNTTIDLSGYDTDGSDDFSGNYNDLSNKPTLFSGNFADLTNVPANLDTDATDDFSGSYDDLTNKPTLFSGNFADLANVPANLDTDATDDFSGSYNDLSNKPTLFSGSYNDLSDTPPIPTNVSDLVNDSGFITSANDADADATNEIQDLSLAGNTLSLSGDATSVNLAPYLDNTDDQTIDVFSFDGTNLSLSLESDGQATKTVDLSSLAGGGAQNLSFNQNIANSNYALNISGGSGVNLASGAGLTMAYDAGTKLITYSVNSSVLTESYSLGGDISGTPDNVKVREIDGVTVDMTTAAPTNGQAMIYDGTSFSWKPGTAGYFQLSGDLVSNSAIFDFADDDFLFGSTTLGDNGSSTNDERMFFDNSKGAFRAGEVASTQWDDANVGANSFAGGLNTTASGVGSTAFGSLTNASGINATAFGYDVEATGNYSFAVGYSNELYTASGDYSAIIGFENNASGIAAAALGGYSNNASGNYSFATGLSSTASNTSSMALGEDATASGANSVAIGQDVTASGANSVALGINALATADGSFALGDASTTSSATFTTNSTANSFFARFSGGYRLISNTGSGSAVGVALAAGANSWSTISDSTRKENFQSIDKDELLDKIASFSISSWNYKGQDPTLYRHYGPMAQEFYAAFGHDGIGMIGNDTTIATSDLMGINFSAIHALEARTKELRIAQEELAKKVAEVAQLNTSLSAMEQRLLKLEALLIKDEVHHVQINKLDTEE